MTPGSATSSRVELKGGEQAVLVGPLHPGDEERYLSGLRRASDDALYTRFMTPVTRGEIPRSQLAYLLEVDHDEHEALLAVDEDTGGAVGVGRFVRLTEEPEVAEMAVLVIDEWQGLGLGKALCGLLAMSARELGITSFEATMLGTNRAMLAALGRLGEPVLKERDGSAETYRVELPELSIGEPVAGILRCSGDDEFTLDSAEGPGE